VNGKPMDSNKPAAEILLDIRQLETTFFTHVGPVQAVRGVDLTVERGEAVGIVGESGCGKSVMSMSIMGLVANPGKIVGGEILSTARTWPRWPTRTCAKSAATKSR